MNIPLLELPALNKVQDKIKEAMATFFDSY
jgi:hypothetical protein